MNAIELAEMGIIPALETIFDKKFPISPGPDKKLREGEVGVARVRSAFTKRLYVAFKQISDHAMNMSAEHLAKHVCGSHHPDECRMYKENIRKLESLSAILGRMLSQGMFEAKPYFAESRPVLRNGWILADQKSAMPRPKIAKNSVRSHYLKRLGNILNGKDQTADEDQLEPVAEGEEVIGVLDDKKLKALRSLLIAIRNEVAVKFQSAPDHRGTKDDELEVQHYEELVKMTGEIFWADLEQMFPNSSGGCLGIREKWQIVRMHDPIEEFGRQLREAFAIGNQESQGAVPGINLSKDLMRANNLGH